MRRHLENLKEKPEHVRHRVALGVSAGVTGLVAVVWLGAHVATGTFALSSPQAAPEDRAAATGFADARGEFSQLMGAVGGTLGASSNEPALTIVDGNTTSTLTPPPSTQNQTDATVIPF